VKLRNLVLTGGTGFIAGNLIEKLAENYKVHALVRSIPEHPKDAKNIIFIKIPELRSDLVSLFCEIKPDICLHMATKFIGVHHISQIPELITSNLEFGTSIAEACIQSGCKKFLNVGTIWQNLGGRNYNPVNLYSATKEAFCKILDYYCNIHGMQVLNIKLSDSYGPGDNRKKVVELLLKAAKENTPIKMSKGEQFIDLVHIQDIVSGLNISLKYLEQMTSKSESFYLTSQSPIKLRDLGSIIESTINKEIPIEWGALPYRPSEVFTKTQYEPQVPGWSPQITLKEGIAQIWKSI
jgi:CDP-paratose synthetase